MADLIDREVLLKGLEVLDDKFSHRVKTEDRGFLALQAGLTYARFLVEDAPAVAAEPVVHAYWIQHDAGPLKSECSACRTTFNTRMEYSLTTKRCPCCGAHMDADAPEMAGKDGGEWIG